MQGRCKFCGTEEDEIEICGICGIHLCIVCGDEEELIIKDKMVDVTICELCKKVTCSACRTNISKAKSTECEACSNKLCLDCFTLVSMCVQCEQYYMGIL